MMSMIEPGDLLLQRKDGDLLSNSKDGFGNRKTKKYGAKPIKHIQQTAMCNI
jgi:hypothetical protein